MKKSPIIVIGSKPSVNLDLSPIIDKFEHNLRVNFGIPGNNNGTRYSQHILNSHMFRNWHTKSKDEFKEIYYKKAHRKYVDDFVDTFRVDKCTHVHNQCMNIHVYNGVLEQFGCPYRFNKLPRCGVNAVFLALEQGFEQVYLTGFSLFEDSVSFYSKCETSDCHDAAVEMEILRWLHGVGIIDATMCLLEDTDFLTVPNVGLPVRLQVLEGMNKPIMLKSDGLFIIHNFYTPDEIHQMESEFTRVFTEHADTIEVLDKEGCSNDERIFNAQSHSPILNELVTNNEFLRNFVKRYTNQAITNDKLLLNRLTFEEGKVKNSGAGWHRDNHTCQFKTLIYLTDVSERNGNFQFILNSSPAHVGFPTPRTPSYNTRFSDETVDKLLTTNPSCSVCNVAGAKGTVVLADTTYIHRGNIIKEGERRAITQYYF